MNASLMAIFAHPDDESFGVGGTLAKYATQGVRVTLVCATSGEVGEIADPSLATPQSLGEVRREELRCACRALGIGEPIFLDYRDSGMAGADANSDPRALINSDAGEVIGRLVRLIRELKPQVLVTFEPGGIYGHPDHMAISRLATEAFYAAGDRTKYQEQLAEELSPYEPSKLYYTAAPRSAMARMAERAAEMGQDAPFQGIDLEHFGTPDEEITTVVDVRDYLETKLRAILCHRTQLSSMPPLVSMAEEMKQEFFGFETFVNTHLDPQATWVNKETDLFEGLSEVS